MANDQEYKRLKYGFKPRYQTFKEYVLEVYNDRENKKEELHDLIKLYGLGTIEKVIEESKINNGL